MIRVERFRLLMFCVCTFSASAADNPAKNSSELLQFEGYFLDSLQDVSFGEG